MLMRQSWGKLLFMHWPVPVEMLRPHLPARLEIDTFEGQAWLALVPFTMSDIRILGVPASPALRELNVRTYVCLDGVPGVWFFSLDADSPLLVWGARALAHLPYLHADFTFQQQADTLTYTTHRTHRGYPAADFAATWTIGAPLPPSVPGSLVHFLTERYLLYAARGQRLYRGRVRHAPWALREATLAPDWHSTVIESHGLTVPPHTPPLLHYAEHAAVQLWPIRQV